MVMKLEELEAEILRLPEESRAKLLARLLGTFEESLGLDQETMEAWQAEAARRDEEMAKEADSGIPADKVIAELRRSQK